MTVNDFIQLVADYRQAGDEFWREQYLTEGDKKSQLRINETFNKWSKLEKEVDIWLLRFRKGVCCNRCKHFQILSVSNDDMDYTRCVHNGENEYTDYNKLCANFEPIED